MLVNAYVGWSDVCRWQLREKPLRMSHAALTLHHVVAILTPIQTSTHNPFLFSLVHKVLLTRVTPNTFV